MLHHTLTHLSWQVKLKALGIKAVVNLGQDFCKPGQKYQGIPELLTKHNIAHVAWAPNSLLTACTL
jgi:hypothetical protein